MDSTSDVRDESDTELFVEFEYCIRTPRLFLHDVVDLANRDNYEQYLKH